MNKALWNPKNIERTTMFKFQKSIETKYNLRFESYKKFHDWSVNELEAFWSELISFYDIKISKQSSEVLESENFDEYTWFKGSKLNFAENLLRNGNDNDTALNFVHESGLRKKISYSELRSNTVSFQQSIKGVLKKGDVLACYMPNIPETVTSMLGATSLGAIFTSTSSDFGVEGVFDRFSQSKPKVLVSVNGYEYNGKFYDLRDRIKELVNKLPSIKKVIIVDFLNKDLPIDDIPKAESWSEFLKSNNDNKKEFCFEPVNFEDPLYIMYSSGTTGKPKCIVHSTGGVLLQHVKELGLHTDFAQEKNIFYFTTCGWMMWNWLVSGLYFGGEIILYEGSPGLPSLEGFFELIEKEEINIFGTSPKFLKALEDSGYDHNFELSTLETILSTGAPLLEEQFDFVYNKIKKEICLSSICGGTDIIGCFMLGSPALPVHRGEIQCLGLGMAVDCYNSEGESLIGEEGELVCKKTFPSRPLYFLNDINKEKIKKAYFNKFEDVWHHGDFITLTKEGSVKVLGRSDATLNPGGVRIGTAEIYRQTEQIDYISDSLCVGRQIDGEVYVTLFVKMKDAEKLDEAKILEIKKKIKEGTTPRHIPSQIYEVSDIPYTRSGKKMELAITRIINGRELDNLQAVSNPECLKDYMNLD